VNTSERVHDFLVNVCAFIFVGGALLSDKQGKLDSCLFDNSKPLFNE
jgi:hypothetical protein